MNLSLLNARRQTGLTQSQLGKIVGRSQRTIAAYESGDRTPPIRVARRLARALDVDIVELLNEVSKEA